MIRQLVLTMMILTAAGCAAFSGEQSNVPDHPVYPNAVLRQTNTINESEPRILSLTYNSRADWRDVVDYFESSMECRLTQSLERFICTGGEMPAGEYTVYIDDRKPSDTFYTIEVAWFE